MSEIPFSLSVLLILSVSGFSNAQDLRGFSRVDYAAGQTSGNIKSDDFNNDGIADLVSSNFVDDSVSIFLGNDNGSGSGDGTFAAAADFAVGDGPDTVLTGDFNDDGITDLATASAGDDAVSIILGIDDGFGSGTGTFNTPVNYSVGDSPLGISAGDFDADGIDDIAASNFSESSLSVLIGNDDGFGSGDGTFTTSVNYGTENGPRNIITDDFNDDGIVDLATTNANSSSVSILLGDDNGFGSGDGTFAAAVNYSVSSTPVEITSGDFNSDGITDLAVCHFVTDSISILIGDDNGFGSGDGTFASTVNYSAGDGARSITTGEFNGDGITDLVVANQNGSNISIFLGNDDGFGSGDGTFAPQINFAVASRPTSVITGDFNADGLVDLAIANSLADDISVLLNLGLTEPEISLSTSSLSFGDFELGSPAATLSAIIDNVGDGDLTISAPLSNNGGGAYSISGTPVSPLAGVTSTTLEVSFAPSGLGAIAGEVTITSNDASSPTLTIALTGTGIDTQAPSSMATGPSGALTQMSSTFDITYSSSDSGSGVDNVELFYRFNSGSYTSYGTFSSSPISFTAAEGDGNYDFYTVATDFAGNPESVPGSADTTVIFNNNTTVDDWSVLND